ncbi:MAG: pyridoxamine 5'-phosphate oxidase [Longimicrobiaceae bacterium]
MPEREPDPLRRFGELLARAERSGLPDATAVALATSDRKGRPSVRMVLLKDFDRRGFRFFTNLGSRKAHDLAENPYAALCAHWPSIESQVRVEGPVERLGDAEADEYFARRPRGSRIGAWASRQSEPMSSRAELERRAAELAERFGKGSIPRPEFWSGFRVRPECIEFWENRTDRLHARELYQVEADGSWRVTLLQP